MKKLFAIACAAVSCALAAGAAQARTDVSWSIGINAAPIGVVMSNGPMYYEPAPAYYQPAPVYYEPVPVYVAPPRVVYQPVPVVVTSRHYYGPSRVVYGGHGGRYWDRRAGHWRHHHHHHNAGWRGHDGRRDEYGSRHRGGWQPVPSDQRRYRH